MRKHYTDPPDAPWPPREKAAASSPEISTEDLLLLRSRCERMPTGDALVVVQTLLPKLIDELIESRRLLP